MLPLVPSPADYTITPEYGFLSPGSPLEVLPNPYYGNLPIFSTLYLRIDAKWRRAYVVLVFMLHGHVWSGDRPAEKIPPQLAQPLFEVCQRLELPPVATYAGLCLWNYKALLPDEPATDLSNLACIQTFTGSLDEQWFYLVSIAIEARGAPSTPIMLQAITAARAGKSQVVTECLLRLAQTLDEINSLLQRMYENCDPYVFYHRIRPYLAGSKNMADAGLPSGLLYDTGWGTPEYHQYSGGSNYQSSLLQFFDIVLGVVHRPTRVGRTDKGKDTATVCAKTRPNFIYEMREYMPGPHRKFLEHVEAVANIRDFVEARHNDSALCLAYDACLAVLRSLRDKHIQIVTRYVIVHSGRSVMDYRAPSPGKGRPSTKNLATAILANKENLRGTGGTALVPFLKQIRDETGGPTIHSLVQRLLSSGPNGGTFAPLSKVEEQSDGHLEVVGLCGTWTADDTEGGICHW